MSYSYRGNLKLEIQTKWMAWVTKVVKEFLAKSVNHADIDTKYDHSCMVIFNLLEDDTFFPFSGFFTPIQLRRNGFSFLVISNREAACGFELCLSVPGNRKRLL